MFQNRTAFPSVEPEVEYHSNRGQICAEDSRVCHCTMDAELKAYESKVIARLIFLIVFAFYFFASSLDSYALSSHSVYVGSRTLLACPNPPIANAAISQAVWGSSGAHLKLEKSGNACYVTATGYFEGIEQVQCDYYYYWYVNNRMLTSHATTYFDFSCRAVTVTPSTTAMCLSVGGGQNLTYSVSPSTIYPQPTVTMLSQNTNVATVNNGYVRAVGAGTTYIRITNNMGPEATCKVEVKKIDPTRVSLPASKQVYVGESATIASTLYPSGATTTLTWYSRNSNVARVSSGGVITGVGEGTTSIYAVSANGVTSNDCAVTVEYRRPTSVAISPSTLNLPISHTSNLTAKVSPSNAKYELSWSCNRNDIVSVSSTGQITALKAGTAVVTVSTDNGRSGQCSVTVPPDPSSISIPSKVALVWHGNRTLDCVVTPGNAYKQLIWSSSDPSVVQVSSNGMLTALAPGTADVTVRTQNGKQATCRVEVDEPCYQFNVWMRSRATLEIDLRDRPLISYVNGSLFMDSKSQRIELDTADVYKFTIENKTKDRMPEQIDLIKEMELPLKTTSKLNAVLLPSDYDIQTRLTWKSDCPDVVSVSSSGQIKALAPGEALITVMASNGCSAVCRVIVPVPYHHLFVWLKDGRYDAYAFSARPKIVHEKGELVVTSRVGTYRYMAEQVHKFTLSDSGTPGEPDAITVPSVAQQPNSMFRQGENVLMQGLHPGEKLYVYGSDGILRKVLTASEDGRLTFGLSGFAAGIYILKTTTTTYKIIKK